MNPKSSIGLLLVVLATTAQTAAVSVGVRKGTKKKEKGDKKLPKKSSEQLPNEKLPSEKLPNVIVFLVDDLGYNQGERFESFRFPCSGSQHRTCFSRFSFSQLDITLKKSEIPK